MYKHCIVKTPLSLRYAANIIKKTLEPEHKRETFQIQLHLLPLN